MDDLSSLSVDTITENDEVINGFKKVDMLLFIYKEASYYLEKFKKNETKKYFASFNWAAFLFGFFWMFYRKMYKAGLLFLLILAIVSSSTLFIASAVIKIESQKIAENLYESNSTLNEENIIEKQKADYNFEYQLEKMLDKLTLKIKVMCSLPIFIYFLIFGIYANSIYRNHVIKNISTSDGGVSVPSIFGAIGILTIYSLIMYPFFKVIYNAII